MARCRSLQLGDTIKRKDFFPGSDAFGVAEKDLQKSLKPTDGEVIVTNRWVESHLPIASIDAEHRLIHFRKQSVFGLELGDRYWIENLKENLTEPGEFYVDADENRVYVIAPQGIDPNNPIIVGPHLTNIVNLEGDIKGGRYVERITFRNLAFAHSEWTFHRGAVGAQAAARATGKQWSFESDTSRSGFGQAAIGVPGAIRGNGVRDCAFEGCEVSHVGNYAIELAEGCQRNRITHCTLTDLGAGGVKLGEVSLRDDRRQQSFENEVADCTITDGGNLFPSCVAVWVGQSHDNRIVHNEIHGFWYTALSIGWTWGYGKAQSQRNLVEYNHIHHIGKKSDSFEPILSDMGGIYTLGNQEGTAIRFNCFHDIAALKYGGWGIYFDEGTTDILAENNLVYRTTHGGFHQHYGKDNIFRNNIIAFGRDAQIQRSRPEDHQSFTLEDNIVLWDHGQLLSGNWSSLGVAFDRNTYWHIGSGDVRFNGRTWAAWHKAGMDEHSKIADPKFKNAAHGNFALTPESASAALRASRRLICRPWGQKSNHFVPTSALCTALAISLAPAVFGCTLSGIMSAWSFKVTCKSITPTFNSLATLSMILISTSTLGSLMSKLPLPTTTMG